MIKDLSAKLVAAAAEINQKSRAKFVEEQNALHEKMAAKQMKMPTGSAPEADPPAVLNAHKMAKTNNGDKSVKEEVEGSIPKTPREKELAAKHGDKKRITFGDVMKARGVGMKKEEVIRAASDLKEAKVDAITHHQNMHDHHQAHAEIHADASRDAEDEDEESHHDSAEEEHMDAAIAHKEALDAHKNNSPDKKQLSYHANMQSKRTKSFYGEEVVDEGMLNQLRDRGNVATGQKQQDRKNFDTNTGAALKPNSTISGIRAKMQNKVQEEAEEVDESKGMPLHRRRGNALNSDADRLAKRDKPNDFGNNPSLPRGKDLLKIRMKFDSGKHTRPNLPEEAEQTQEGWNDMMKSVNATKGTGKFDKKEVKPGVTQYTRKSSTFDDGTGKDSDERRQDRERRKAVKEENMDTPGNSTHQCAIHVKSEQFGEGRTLTSQHAEPDAQGNIAWYDVMFAEGIKRVETKDVEVLVSEAHMMHKKKKKAM